MQDSMNEFVDHLTTSSPAESKAIQTKLGRGFIFHGNKIGWSPNE